MSNQPIIIERTFHAPIAKVWQAITDNDEMKKWYFNLADFKPEVGFTFQFKGGPDEGPQYVHLCEVTQVVPGKKIAYTWRYEGLPGSSEVIWELFEKGEDTLLKLTHSGVDSFSENGKDFAANSFNEGWTHFVHIALKKYFEEK